MKEDNQDNDGCAKQYRCGNAIYCNALLLVRHGIFIDVAIGAPGHGKDMVDGIGAVEKKFLSGYFCLIGTPEAACQANRIKAASMTGDGYSKSLAVECARLCRDNARVSGVKGYKKHAKRENAARIKHHEYYVHTKDEANATNLNVKVTGLEPGPFNGLGSMYNIRTEPKLGPNRAAVRRIPCACDGCKT